MSRTLLSIKDMTIGHGDRILYSGMSLDIREGDCIMLCGANGSGKTTFLRNLAASSDETVMIPARILKVKGFTLKEFIRVSCFRERKADGRLTSQGEKAIDDALELLGLTPLASRDISTLSDGEFQKGAIAAALVRKAGIILMDEPTAFLDAENRKSVLMTIRHLCEGRIKSGSEKRPAVIFSTHDLHDGLEAAGKVIALGADGKVHIGTASDNSMEAAVKRIFTTLL